MGWVEATMGRNGRRWLSDTGTQYYLEDVAQRIRLSPDAERLARRVAEVTADPQIQFVRYNVILESLGLDEARYRRACQELEDRGLLIDKLNLQQMSYAGVALTPQGRNAVRDDFRLPTPPSYSIQPQIGAIFHGPVIQSTVQTIVAAHSSQIEQAISQADTAALQAQISALSQQLVEAVQPVLTTDEHAAYERVAEELQSEVAKPHPDATVLHRLLSILNFAATTDGVIELGRKAFELSTQVDPIIQQLRQAILALLS
jgi:hypothetical protein